MIRWVLIFLAFLSSCNVLESLVQEKSRTHSVDTIYLPVESLGPVVSARKVYSSQEKKIVYVKDVQFIEKEKLVEVNSGVEKIRVKTVYGDPGSIVYSIPDSMSIGKTYRIKIRIQSGSSPIGRADLKNVRESKIRTSSVMRVDLLDPESNAFTITKINGEEQIVESGHFTQWDFSVSPIKFGKKNLLVRIAIKTDKGEKEIVFEDNVVVKNRVSVQVKNFWKENWKWIFSTMLIPIFIYFWDKSKKRKEDK